MKTAKAGSTRVTLTHCWFVHRQPLLGGWLENKNENKQKKLKRIKNKKQALYCMYQVN